MNHSLVLDLATGNFIAHHDDGLFFGPPGTGKSRFTQAIGQAVIQQGYRVQYRETHVLLDELADATIDGTRRDYMAASASVPLLVVDDLGMRKLPLTAAEDLLEIVLPTLSSGAGTLVTSTRPVEDWGKLLGDAAAISAMLDRLLHHGHVLRVWSPQLAHQDRSQRRGWSSSPAQRSRAMIVSLNSRHRSHAGAFPQGRAHAAQAKSKKEGRANRTQQLSRSMIPKASAPRLLQNNAYDPKAKPPVP